MPALPYPFERLPRLDAREAVESRRVARALAARSLDRAGALVTALLGADATLEAGPLERCPAGELASSVVEPLVACILEAESGAPGARIALELDPRIALVIIDRALGGSGGADVPVPVAGLTDAERGVLAYVVARLAAEAGAGWLVTGVVTTRAALAFAIGDAGASVAPHRVAIGEDRGVARVWLGARAEGALALAPAPRLTDALATLPVDVVVEGAIGTLAPDDATALSMGDVVLLENTWVARDAAGGFSGEVRARIDGAARMRMRCSLGSSGLSVIAIDVDASIAATNAKTKGRGMEPDTERQVLDRASDAPIPVSIEIARFSLPLAELSQIQVGEVLVTGKVIGERVALRAGDRVLATGELVDVDGEVGLRILELAP
jgi:flagellar motor switch/type III secretory pathway protein FliN